MAPKSQARSTAFDYFLISNDEKHYICQCKKEDSVEQLCAGKVSTNSDSKSPNITGKTSNCFSLIRVRCWLQGPM